MRLYIATADKHYPQRFSEVDSVNIAVLRTAEEMLRILPY